MVGDASLLIHGVGGLADAGPGELSFFGHPKYLAQVASTRATAVLVPDVGNVPLREGLAFIRVATPHLAFARIAQLFHPGPKHPPGISAQAFVDASASVDATATVMPFASVGPGARVGARVVLYPGVFLGEGAEVGDDSVLHPSVTVREHCQVGKRCILHASAVIGADGFGFAFDPETPAHVKIPQTGIVRIEDDVEIGAGTCVDRATSGETVIGRGTKIDNLVQVAHNVRVGALSILCAQAGVSGSAELGTGVVLAGQVGVVGHIRIGDGAKVSAQSGVAHDVEDGDIVSGSPAVSHRSWIKNHSALQKLPALLKAVRDLERRLATLELDEETTLP